MSYERVNPRDLFNEANLLKCYGKLFILLENHESHRMVFDDSEVQHYDVRQNEDDGSLTIDNIHLILTKHRNTEVKLFRPLNSRRSWPLIAIDHNNQNNEVLVFDEEGELSEEFKDLLKMDSLIVTPDEWIDITTTDQFCENFLEKFSEEAVERLNQNDDSLIRKEFLDVVYFDAFKDFGIKDCHLVMDDIILLFKKVGC